MLITDEDAPSPQEQRLYDLLYTYINQPVKLAFPEMDRYDLALRLQGSSAFALNFKNKKTCFVDKTGLRQYNLGRLHQKRNGFYD